MRKVIYILFTTLICGNLDANSSEQSVTLGTYWDDAIKGNKAIYGCQNGVFRPLMDQLLFESPFPYVPIISLIDPSNDFSNVEAKKFATDCKVQFSNYFDQVGCISRQINKYFKDKKITGKYSLCKSIAYAFDKTFKKLDIPHSNSSKFLVEGNFKEGCEQSAHILNRFTIVSADGTPYSYAIDSGWFPGKIFPLTKLTKVFHENHNSFPNLTTSSCNVTKTGMTKSWIPELLLKLMSF